MPITSRRQTYHLDNAGYALDQKAAKNGGLTPEKVGQELVAEERCRQVLNSLVIFLFARNLYTPELVQRALHAAGMEWSGDDLARLGQETLTLKHEFKRGCGFDLEGCGSRGVSWKLRRPWACSTRGSCGRRCRCTGKG